MDIKTIMFFYGYQDFHILLDYHVVHDFLYEYQDYHFLQ